VGSLNSAYRSVYQILDFEHLDEQKRQLVKEWGIVEEVEYGDFTPETVVATSEARTTTLTTAAQTSHATARESIASVIQQGRSKLRCKRI
jgi:hypothetical protein